MKSLVLSSTSIFLSLKNELKIFSPTETYEKGRPALGWSLLEHTTLARLLPTHANLTHNYLDTNH